MTTVSSDSCSFGDYNSSQCKQTMQAIDPALLRDTSAEIMDKLNIRACTTKQGQVVDSVRTSDQNSTTRFDADYSMDTDRDLIQNTNSAVTGGSEATSGPSSTGQTLWGAGSNARVGKTTSNANCSNIFNEDINDASSSNERDILNVRDDKDSRTTDKLYQESTMDTIGCEQIDVISEKYLEKSNAIMCILNQSCKSTKLSTNTVNEVNIILDNDARFMCDGGLEIIQGIDVDLSQITDASDAQKQDIAQILKGFAKESLETMQGSQVGFMGTIQGQKSLNNAIKGVETNVNIETIKQIVNESITTMAGNNILNITAKGRSTISGLNCKIDQKIVFKLAIQNMFESTLDQQFKTEEVRQFYKDNKQFQDMSGEGYDPIDLSDPSWQTELGLGGLQAGIDPNLTSGFGDNRQSGGYFDLLEATDKDLQGMGILGGSVTAGSDSDITAGSSGELSAEVAFDVGVGLAWLIPFIPFIILGLAVGGFFLLIMMKKKKPSPPSPPPPPFDDGGRMVPAYDDGGRMVPAYDDGYGDEYGDESMPVIPGG
jgi:hypothetical protein